MKRIVLFAAAVALSACGAKQQAADQAPSVLVTTIPLRQGSAQEWLTAYGSAMPSANGAETMSVPQPGQVTSLSVIVGTPVRAGQPLLVFTVAPSAASAYMQAANALATAQKQRETTALLLAQQLATKDQLAQAEKAVADAQATVSALRQEGASAPVRTIAAPFAGVVTTVSVAQGDRTQPGAPLLTVARSGEIVAAVGVDPALQPQVKVGAAARVTRLNGAPPVMGRVTRTGAALNPKTRLIDVEVAFPAGAFLPNEALRAEIATRQIQGWLVPHKAVVTADGPPRIFQVVDGKAHAAPIQILMSSDTGDVVQGQPRSGAPLIVDGAYQVSDGVAVRQGAGS